MTVTKILNGGGGLSEELMDGASQVFPRAAIFSAYGISSYQPLHWTSLTVTICKHEVTPCHTLSSSTPKFCC